jgi:IclR family mhp operon transcriptional activator
VLATVGMTYFMSALDRRDVMQRYAPLIQALAENISSSVAALR